MKVWLIISCLFLFEQPNWLTDYNEARKQASESNKTILLNFSGSDWCVPCMRMKKDFFESQAFTQYASESLVLLRADFPRNKKNKLSAEQIRKNESLADQYNPQGKFPYTLLLDQQGKVLRSWDGCPDGTVASFIESIKRVQPAVSETRTAP